MDRVLLWAWKRCPHRVTFWVPGWLWCWWTGRMADYLTAHPEKALPRDTAP